MTTDAPVVEPPRPLFDLLLRLAPADILLFDSELRCHYAAPVGDRFLGIDRAHLVGRSATEILPSERTRLRLALTHAVQRAMPWEATDYTLNGWEGASPSGGRYTVQIVPVVLPDFTGALLLLSPIGTLADERDQLQAELAGYRQREAARTEAMRRLHAQVRTQITPVIGYLQLLVRRPAAFGGRTAASVIGGHVLPVLDRLIETLDRLRDATLPAPDAGTHGSHEPAA